MDSLAKCTLKTVYEERNVSSVSYVAYVVSLLRISYLYPQKIYPSHLFSYTTVIFPPFSFDLPMSLASYSFKSIPASVRTWRTICLIVVLVVVVCGVVYAWRTSSTPSIQSESFLAYGRRKYRPIYQQTGTTFNPRTRTLTNSGHRYTVSRRNNINHPSSAALTTSKHITSRLLELHNIPTPPYVYIHTLANRRRRIRYTRAELRALLYPLRNDYPLTLKPVDGQQGKGITLHITSPQRLIRLYTHQYGHRDVLVQKHLFGDNYRALVVQQSVLEVVRFEKTYIVGDGVHTIQQLVRRHLQQHRRGGRDPRTMVDWQAVPYPSTYIIPDGDRVVLSHNTNNHQNHGTVLKTVVPLDTIHPSTLTMFIRINTVLGLTMSGIDCNIVDIGEPCETTIQVLNQQRTTRLNTSGQNGYILEVNSNPGVEVHSQGTNIHILQKLLT